MDAMGIEAKLKKKAFQKLFMIHMAQNKTLKHLLPNTKKDKTQIYSFS